MLSCLGLLLIAALHRPAACAGLACCFWSCMDRELTPPRPGPRSRWGDRAGQASAFRPSGFPGFPRSRGLAHGPAMITTRSHVALRGVLRPVYGPPAGAGFPRKSLRGWGPRSGCQLVVPPRAGGDAVSGAGSGGRFCAGVVSLSCNFTCIKKKAYCRRGRPLRPQRPGRKILLLAQL
jgi:hypothetical protein